MIKNTTKPILSFCLLACTVHTAEALKKDELQPLHVESSRFNLDYASGIATYEGEVVATQGTRKLQGNKLVIHSSPHGAVEKIIAYGEPAHYEYQPDNEPQLARAKAGKIQFEPDKHLFTLTDKAQITRQGNVFNGPIITYNTATEVIDSPSSNKGRSSMTINAQTKTDTGSPAV